ncbi:hypothetical protein AB0F11_02960 [Streptomyces sp. NPDC032472]|uniref:hypothetical protein n=1 Tax=Streptomyces sp. NPDC032472 TaxID=3155018 RepID=UPI0033C83690
MAQGARRRSAAGFPFLARCAEIRHRGPAVDNGPECAIAHAMTRAEVASLALPGMLFEVDAVAVRAA